MWDAGFEVSPSLLGNKTGYKVLTQKENTDIWKRSGSLVYDTINVLLQDPSYAAVPDEIKADHIETIVENARDVAKIEAFVRKLEGLEGDEMMDMFVRMTKEGLMAKQISGKLGEKGKAMIKQYEKDHPDL